MKIGFIGIGQVGGTLAKILGSHGHSIFLGTRDQANEEALGLARSVGANAVVLSVQEAIAQSEIIFLATPWSAVEGIAKEYAKILAGKILIDCANPLKSDLTGLLFTGENSGGEYIQQILPKTKIVKAFNTVGYNIMENPVSDGRRAMMYFCGNDQDARFKTQTLIQEVGFEPIDAGDIKSSRLLESLALLWISTAYKFGFGRNFLFSIIKTK
jgi:8-hydroxy-5-deazaflavin:NADPH oxidoreductase